ncbi:MAG: thrombospondin type 3 repeat-containing protein, partial [Lachnospiraceae bacterium]|nr:thrombospondin type 3 repeat-containing protein [Lachnospiraceae bacterium]
GERSRGLGVVYKRQVLNEDFTTFTGSLKRVEQVKELTVKVYDKKDILIYQEDITPKSAWSMEKVALVYGINRLVFAVSAGDGYEESKEITVQMDSSVYMENLQVDCDDTDGDGLFNYLEDLFETDKTEKDTDGDGLTDYEELYLFGYNPLETDTDGDEISDYDEDEDEDGISNGEELSKGYLPLDDDSDNDGLTDGEELAFGTSPLNPNTHRKDITDYEEFQLEQLQCSYDAETEQYIKTFCYEQDEEDYQEPVVPTLAFTGDAQGVLSFQMKRVSGSAYLNPSMTGYLGAAFDFSTAGKMEKAELTFSYDEELLGKDLVSQESFRPTIYYYNEETGLLEEVEGQVWKGNQVTVTLSHFSTYILANKADLEALWERTQIVDNTLTKGEKPLKETMIIMDYSDQMERYDRNAVHRKEIILDYIDHQWEEDESLALYVLGVKGRKEISCFFYRNGFTRESVREGVYKVFDQMERYGHEESYKQLGYDFWFIGSTDLYSYWKNRDSNNEDRKPVHRNMYWMTNGSFASLPVFPYWYNIYDAVDHLCQGSKEFDYACQMIGFGYETDKRELLQSMAERMNGNYYQYDTSFDMNRCYQETQPDQSGDGTDKNNDGLNDELEKKICDGEITTISGTTIFSPDSYDKLMESDDYDGDGLKNGEEIEIYQYRKATYFRLKSLPYIYDSDCDGYSDYEEVKEMNTPPCKANFVMKYSDVSYLNNMDQFESVKAFNKYADSKGIGNVVAKSLDVLFCGGEISLNKAMSKELAECLAEDAKENETTAMVAGVADFTNTYVAGLVALLPKVNELDYNFHKNDYMDSINNLQKAIKILKQDGDSKELLHTFQTSLQNHRNTWKDDIVRLGRESDNIKIYGNIASFTMGVMSSAEDEINEWEKYYAELSQLVGYRDVLQKLSCCQMEDVEAAAKKILKELDGEYGDALKQAAGKVVLDFVVNIAKSVLIKQIKKMNVVVSLLDIAAGIVLEDSMSVGLQNSISVNIALELSVLSNGTVTRNTIQKDCTGNTQVVYDDASNYLFARKLWLSTIHTIKHCEENYQSYISSASSLLNRKMLYYTKDSSMNVTYNLIELLRMHNQYAM